MKKKYIIISLIAVVCLVLIYLASLRIDVEKVVYKGNERLGVEELEKHIFGEGIELNPFVFWFKKTFMEHEHIPFVEKYDMEMNSLSDVTVTVYEKDIVGYIVYMGTYMYFDKDGIVVENSTVSYEDVPQITGIKFDSIILHEVISIENKKVFDVILDVTQQIKKHNVDVKKINVSELLDITLYVGQFRVELGNDGRFSEKVSTFSDILPNMKDIPGELDMREYDTNGSGYIFKKD